ncbi:hypothetical protein T11_8999 [Trichinella zimbabwensis]|uniref:Uncharacterized protein n=1 Tax=Trichinella zimbabwensis TaxID=268475 RepID=A0A0V1HLW7_9BILA|nr:hypothetical protein T11_8999 [Trichinella zimbabwensis]
MYCVVQRAPDRANPTPDGHTIPFGQLDACSTHCARVSMQTKLGCIKLPGPLCEMVRHPAVPLNHRSALA